MINTFLTWYEIHLWLMFWLLVGVPVLGVMVWAGSR